MGAEGEIRLDLKDVAALIAGGVIDTTAWGTYYPTTAAELGVVTADKLDAMIAEATAP